MDDGFGTSAILRIVGAVFALLVVIFLILPSVIVVPMSFSGADLLEFPPSSWSLRWYRTFFGSLAWLQAAQTSLIVGALTVVLALPLGTLAAWGARDLPLRARVAIGAVLLLPAIIPAILLAIGLFFVLAKIGILGGIVGLVIGHTALALPIVYLILSAGFADFDPNQERAAESLGAGRLVIWGQVVLPQIRGSLIAAALLAFMTSLDDAVLAMFISTGDTSTLPKVMFASLRDKIDPTVAAVSTLLIAAAVLAVLAAARQYRRPGRAG